MDGCYIETPRYHCVRYTNTTRDVKPTLNSLDLLMEETTAIEEEDGASRFYFVCVVPGSLSVRFVFWWQNPRPDQAVKACVYHSWLCPPRIPTW